MPQILEDLVSHLKGKGYAEQSAYAIAHSTLVKSGDITHDGQLTQQGKARQALGHAGRVRARAAKIGSYREYGK